MRVSKEHRAAESRPGAPPSLRWTGLPEWDDRQYRSIRMRLWRDKLAAWWQGRQDGRAGLPELPEKGEPSTPYLRELERHRDEVAERERLLAVEDTTLLTIRLQEVAEQIRCGREELEVAEAELAGLAAPDDDELSTPRSGEEHLHKTVIRQRRLRQHERKIGPVRARVTAARSKLAELQQEQAWLHEQISRRVRGAQRRAGRFEKFSQRCVARYGRALVRRHPEGAALATLRWPALPEPPAWVGDPDPLGVVASAALRQGDA